MERRWKVVLRCSIVSPACSGGQHSEDRIARASLRRSAGRGQGTRPVSRAQLAQPSHCQALRHCPAGEDLQHRLLVREFPSSTRCTAHWRNANRSLVQNSHRLGRRGMRRFERASQEPGRLVLDGHKEMHRAVLCAGAGLTTGTEQMGRVRCFHMRL